MNRNNISSLFQEAISFNKESHFFNDSTKNVLLVSAYIDGISNLLNEKEAGEEKLSDNIALLRSRLDFSQFDFIIATDGGLSLCEVLSLDANLVIGDFDSHSFLEFSKKKNIPFEKLPVEKDITDLEAGLLKAMSLKPNKLCILGGMGGRLDHSLANIEHLVNFGNKVDYIYFIDCYNFITVQYPSTRKYDSKLGKHFAIISHSEVSYGVTLENAYYNLDNAVLCKNTPLGVSNSFTKNEVILSFEEGCLLVIISNYK